MRLPKNYETSSRIISAAVNRGINYFDTAFLYPGNEALLGKILKAEGLRDSVKIATKLPSSHLQNLSDGEKKLNTQLKRLNTDHIDYYLMHMLPDLKTWNLMGAERWLQSKKEEGTIGQIGFSYHGGYENFVQLLDGYDWDFVQVQYNYLDEYFQVGRDGVQYATDKGIPIVVMEPLRGGLLVDNLPKKSQQLMNSQSPPVSPVQASFQWLWTHPGIKCILSGMKSVDMVEENCNMVEEFFHFENSSKSSIGGFSLKAPIDINKDFYAKLKHSLEEGAKIPCTGCSYCMPCPFNVGIATNFRSYNVRYVDGYFKGFKEYILCNSFSQKPTDAGQCTGCGKCKRRCPQSIDIPKEMKKVKALYEHLPYRIIQWIINRKYKLK